MKLNRPITGEDLRDKGFPFECTNCGSKPTPQQVADHRGSCEVCGSAVTAYTVDVAEFILDPHRKHIDHRRNPITGRQTDHE